MSIEELLTNWKNNALFGERYFEKQSITLIEGQKLYLISDLRFVQELLGLSSRKTAEIHTHFSTKMIQKIKSPFNDL